MSTPSRQTRASRPGPIRQFQAAPLGAELRPDAEGFLSLSRKGVFELFAQDLDQAEKALVYATQGPIHGAALGGVLTKAAWHGRPTFYLIGDQDHAIPRAEQEKMAARMDATIEHVNASQSRCCPSQRLSRTSS